MQDHSSLIVKLYNFFYNKIYRAHSNITYASHKEQVDSFLNMLGEHYDFSSLGPNWFISYFCWTFAIRESQNTSRDISLNWIIGNKMLTRWLEKPEEFSWQYRDFVVKYSIDLDRLRNDLFESGVILRKLDPAEEREKSRLGGEGQLYNCLLHTTLYNHRSIICLTCENKILCKKLLAQKYPRLSRERGYEATV